MELGDGATSVVAATMVAELQARIVALSGERDEYKQLADLFRRELERLRDLQKTPREHVDAGQVQLAFAAFAAELLARAGAPRCPRARGSSPRR
jgi:formiminotetrahydrofolate cyclodeaminase